MDFETAKSLFDYQDGFLVWKKSIGRVKAGKKVETVNNRGYVMFQFQKKHYCAHRIIWLLANGRMPNMIDHIDGNKQNNLLDNLREVDNTLNHWNEWKRSTNKSGHKGVWWHKQSKRWEAACRVNGKQKTVGRYERIEDAIEAVRKFREQHHGEYTNHG
jgi:hypothetical protein